ncbi:unnamed protein product [Rhodiola kirilowii]
MSHGIDYSWVYLLKDCKRFAGYVILGNSIYLFEKTYPITQVREAHKAKDNRIIIGKWY